MLSKMAVPPDPPGSGQDCCYLGSGARVFEVGGTMIYVDHIVEIGAVPPEGALLRWVRYRGEGSSIYKSLPLGDGGGMLATYTTDDPDQEVSELEPFVVIGA